MNQSLLNAIQGKKQERYPLWFLRQAGRYLPEYRELRKDHSFLDLCSNPSLAAEITLQPTRRFDLDAAIVFADILLPLIPLGQTLSFKKDHGPLLQPSIRSSADFKQINSNPDVKSLSYVGETISIVRSKLKSSMSVIGFAGAPFTVASYMIEGQGTKNFQNCKQLVFSEPDTFKAIMSLLTETTVEYLRMQAEAGADALMLFDSWAGALAPMDYEKHVLPHMKTLSLEVKKFNKPIIYYPGANPSHCHMIKKEICDVLHLDWRLDVDNFIKQRADDANKPSCLQGNLDPQALFLPEQKLRARTKALLDSFNQDSSLSHIFNVGHGLIPQVPIKSLEIVIDEVRSYKK